MEGSVLGIIIIVVIILVIAILTVRKVREGYQAEIPNEFPNVLFSVIYLDKKSVLLEEIGVKGRRFLTSPKIFGGKPIRPKDTVRKIQTNKERKVAGIPVLGYPPFIKVEEEEGGQL